MANYENIRLEKGMYAGSFTANLEKIDPSESYRETPLENLDAFERQLKRFDIRVSGSNSNRVEKFFESSDSAVLFPEYIARAIKQGMKDADMLSNIVATTTQVDAPDYRPLVLDMSGTGENYPIVDEGETLHSLSIKNGTELVTMKKHGRVINTSYEALRFHRLDLFTVFLKQLGAQFAQERFEEAVGVLADGASETQQASTTLEYGDLLNLWTVLQPYNVSTMVVNRLNMKDVMKIAQLQDSPAGLNFHATGHMVTPLGAALVPSSTLPVGKTILALDKSCALEMITAGDVMLESGRLIDRQLDRTTVSCFAGFSKIIPGARAILKPQA